MIKVSGLSARIAKGFAKKVLLPTGLVVGGLAAVKGVDKVKGTDYYGNIKNTAENLAKVPFQAIGADPGITNGIVDKARGIVGGAVDYVDKNVVPAVTQGAKTVSDSATSAWDNIVNYFNPNGRSNSFNAPKEPTMPLRKGFRYRKLGQNYMIQGPDGALIRIDDYNRIYNGK